MFIYHIFYSEKMPPGVHSPGGIIMPSHYFLIFPALRRSVIKKITIPNIKSSAQNINSCVYPKEAMTVPPMTGPRP